MGVYLIYSDMLGLGLSDSVQYFLIGLVKLAFLLIVPLE